MSTFSITIQTDNREATCRDKLPTDFQAIDYDHQFPIEEVGELIGRCLLSSGVRSPAQVIAYACQMVIFYQRTPLGGLDEVYQRMEFQLEEFLRHCYQHDKAKTEG